ncbi:hypothetical protein TIFTF001_002255 [Ficus carica]|uniref:Uncharacterized protein n=1 Tax=Ficus carica TaxID=3494 RepID=A0AA88CRV5_FICCA|nr:hypothetical protein TIFTF001_002255 [Ficus carica]
MWHQKSRISWMKDGDKCSKFFFLSTVRRRRRNFLSRLEVNPDHWMSSRHDIGEVFVEHFKRIYYSEDTTPQSISIKLADCLQGISTVLDDRGLLDFMTFIPSEDLIRKTLFFHGQP